MPTRAELPRPGLGYEEQPSWTDDLPVCKQSGVGLSTNQIYRRDGHRREEHPFEDASFHLQVDNEDTYLYGVFDGHNGVQTATFALQSLASEILLDTKLAKKTSDDEIREFLRQAFIAVEKSYLESIDDRLAERTSLMYEIPEGMKLYEAYKSHPHVVEKLNTLNYELSCGTTAVVAFVTNGQLFVANVGDSRALLCKNDENGVLRVIQLSVDHDLSNEDELLRLYNLGLQIDVSKGCRLGNQKNTRCLGNYLVKGAYKEFEELAAASSEPITAEPEIHGGIKLDNSCRFLLLMSDGLYKSLEEATGIDHDQVNKEIVQMVVQEFRVQSTLTGVAQAVVDKVVRIHHDMYMGGEGRGQGSRDDITLLVRNFNFPLPNALSPSTPTVRFPATQVDAPLPTGNELVIKTQSDTSCDEITETFSTDDTSSSGETRPNAQKKPDERIKPYVDFTEYYRNIELARLEGTLPAGIEF